MNEIFDGSLLIIGLVVCPALVIGWVRARVSEPRHAAFAAAAAVAVPWLMATAWALFISAMAHTKQAYYADVFDMTLYGLLVLPPVAAIWMYGHKRGGGMRGILGSVVTGSVNGLKFLRRWGLDEHPAHSPVSDDTTPEGDGDGEKNTTTREDTGYEGPESTAGDTVTEATLPRLPAR